MRLRWFEFSSDFRHAHDLVDIHAHELMWRCPGVLAGGSCHIVFILIVDNMYVYLERKIYRSMEADEK
jgi:hypothetical protein